MSWPITSKLQDRPLLHFWIVHFMLQPLAVHIGSKYRSVSSGTLMQLTVQFCSRASAFALQFTLGLSTFTPVAHLVWTWLYILVRFTPLVQPMSMTQHQENLLLSMFQLFISLVLLGPLRDTFWVASLLHSGSIRLMKPKSRPMIPDGLGNGGLDFLSLHWCFSLQVNWLLTSSRDMKLKKW